MTSAVGEGKCLIWGINMGKCETLFINWIRTAKKLEKPGDSGNKLEKNWLI